MATPESQEKQAKWLQARIEYIKKLPPAEQSDIQKLLLILAESPGRTTEENKHFEALLKSEKAEERAESARIAARVIVTNRRDEENKARSHRLIQLGGLIELAGLGGQDRGALLGALLGISKMNADHPRWAEWKRDGDTLLEQRAEETKKARKGKKATDPAPGPEPVRQPDPYQSAG